MGGAKVCRLCAKNIGKNKLKLQCGTCHSYFHIECCDISELEARLMMAEKRSWVCTGCEVDGPSRSRLSMDSSRVSISNTRGSADDLELKSLIKSLQGEVRELRKSVDFLGEKYEEERKRNLVIAEMLDDVLRENKLLKQDMERLKSTLNVQQRQQVKNNIRVNGLEYTDGDDVGNLNKIKKVFNYINVDLSREEVADIKYFKRNSIPNIVLSLKSIDKKREILKARARKGRLTLRSCGLATSDSQVFLDEELTRETYVLFKKAKKLKDIGFKYVWHRDGRVLARKNDGGDITVIKNKEFLNEIINN